MSKRVLITGATGDIGSKAVKFALELGLDVRAFVLKKDEKALALQAQGAELAVGDLQDINSIREALRGVETAFFLYPVAPGLLTAAVNFAQAASEAGVMSILNLSQRSANRESQSDSCRDSFIEEQVFNNFPVPVVTLRPTFFLEWLLYPWNLPYIQGGALRLPAGSGRHSPIATYDIARSVAALLKNPEPYIGQIVPLSGPSEMNHTEIAAELSEALDRTIVFQDQSPDEYADDLEKIGFPPYVVQHFRYAWQDYQNGKMSGADNNVERITGKRSLSVGEFAKQHIDLLNAK